MKILNNIIKAFFAAIFLVFAATGCKESAELSIDPIAYDTLFIFTPLHGYPGNTVIITGTDLSGVEQVAFGNVKGEITSQSATEINVVVPVGALSSKIKLVKANSVLTSLKNFLVDASPIPTVIEFTPAIAGSGETVTIAGSLLNIVDSVYVGNLKAGILTGKTATELKFTTPVGLQTAFIRMFYNYKTSYGMIKVAEASSATKLSLKLPTIESISPGITTLNIGQQLTIVGTMFNAVTSVKFSTPVATVNLNATFTVVSPTEMTVTVPAVATTGKITMTVPDGTAEYKDSYVVTLPAIISFFPFKGAELVGGIRDIVISGTKLDLVTSVKVGATTATIMAQTATNMSVRILGATSGVIALTTTNGVVKSTSPFIITGDFWLADYDNMFTPVRLFNEPMYSGASGSESWADATQNTKTIVASGQARGNYRRFTITFNATGSPRIYIRGDQGAPANPANDRFLLYTPSSQGVNFEFDISWDAIPAAMVDANGKVDLKLMFFNADQTAGGGYGYYTGHILVPYQGAGVWQHVVVDTYQTRVANSDDMYNLLVPPVSTQKFAPNNCRIITIMFQGAYNSTVPGQQMTVNLDNIKFVIN